jgi:hypothetical protein
MLDDVEERQHKKKQMDYADMTDELKSVEGQWIKAIKMHLFSTFYYINGTKASMPVQYHILVIVIEALQLWSLVFVDVDYTKLGPYEDESPWDASTQWLIDLCWLFRFDRYFRTSQIGLIIF